MKRTNKKTKAQEEIAGFAIILVIVAIILLVFLVIYLKKPNSDNIQSYQVNSFIQAFLQVTTTCEQNSENLSVQKLISECQKGVVCSYGMKSCKVLNDTLIGILDESWSAGEEFPVKGYQLNITAKGKEMLIINKGRVTSEWKGSSQPLPKEIYILFNAYY